jgi:hypothetical protein
MFSVPAQRVTLALPSIILSDPKHTVSKPLYITKIILIEMNHNNISSTRVRVMPPYLPHNLLILNEGVLIAAPDFNATWRDKYAASELDCITLPTKHSSIAEAGTFASAIAALDAWTAKSVALNNFNLPPKAPKGVLLAPTIKIPITLWNYVLNIRKRSIDAINVLSPQAIFRQIIIISNVLKGFVSEVIHIIQLNLKITIAVDNALILYLFLARGTWWNWGLLWGNDNFNCNSSSEIEI